MIPQTGAQLSLVLDSLHTKDRVEQDLTHLRELPE